ncbi:MFS transporter [Chloroflexota bacterium]
MPTIRRKKNKIFYGYIVVLAGFFIIMIAYGTLYSFGVFFKPMLTEFGWTRAMTSSAYSMSYLLFGLLSILMGRLNDRFGPRLIVTTSGLFLGLGYLLMSQISSVWQLYLFYGVFVSIGMSSAVPLTSVVARWFVKRRGLMSGIVLSGVGAGTVIMPPVSSQLIASYSWRTSYLIIGIVALVLTVSLAQLLRSDPNQVRQLPDGAEEVELESLDLGVQGFSTQETIRTKQFWIISAVFFFAIFCQQTMMVHIVPYATDIGISEVSAASIVSIIGGLSIAGRIGMGSAGDRIGNKPSLVIVLVLVSVALFWLQLARELWMLYLFAVLFGFGYGGAVALQTLLVAGLFGLRSHGTILGMIVFAVTLGGAIGSLIAGWIFDMTGSYHLSFLLCAVLSTIALAVASLLKTPQITIEPKT